MQEALRFLSPGAEPVDPRAVARWQRRDQQVRGERGRERDEVDPEQPARVEVVDDHARERQADAAADAEDRADHPEAGRDPLAFFSGLSTASQASADQLQQRPLTVGTLCRRLQRRRAARRIEIRLQLCQWIAVLAKRRKGIAVVGDTRDQPRINK